MAGTSARVGARMVITGESAAGGRVRTLAGFAALGAFWGAWGAVLPATQRHAGVGDGQLGVALLCVGAGALVAMRGAGAFVDRSGGLALPVLLAAFGLSAVRARRPARRRAVTRDACPPLPRAPPSVARCARCQGRCSCSARCARSRSSARTRGRAGAP